MRKTKLVKNYSSNQSIFSNEFNGRINMENALSILAVLVYCIVVGYYDIKNHKSIMTPFIFIIVPYTIVVVLINTIGVYYEFFSVNLKSVMFVILCVSFFKFGGWYSQFLYKQNQVDVKIRSFNEKELTYLFNRYKTLFVWLAIISIVASIIHFRNALKEVGGWFYIASIEFEDAYGKGLLSHVGQLNRPAFTFLFAYYFFSKKKYILFLLVGMFISVLVLQIKAHIITILLSGIIFANLLNVIKVNFKKTLLFCVLILVLFNVSYVIGYSRIGMSSAYSSKVQLYLMYQFFTYLFGGVLGFSEVINDAIYPLYSSKEIFAIPINIYNTITGNPELVDVIVHRWVSISKNYQYFHSSNVFTFFGMLFMYIGSLYTYIYMFIIGIVSYILKALAFKIKPYIGFQMTYAFYLSFIALSFFDIYFNQLQIYHTSFLMIVIPVCFDITLTLKSKISMAQI